MFQQYLICCLLKACQWLSRFGVRKKYITLCVGHLESEKSEQIWLPVQPQNILLAIRIDMGIFPPAISMTHRTKPQAGRTWRKWNSVPIVLYDCGKCEWMCCKGGRLFCRMRLACHIFDWFGLTSDLLNYEECLQWSHHQYLQYDTSWIQRLTCTACRNGTLWMVILSDISS